MKTLRAVWWSPVLTSLLVGFILFFVLPSSVLQTQDARSAMILFIGVGCALFPWIIARLHGLPRLRLVSAFYVIMTAGWLSKPNILEAENGLAVITPWLLMGVLMIAAASSLMLRKILRSSPSAVDELK